MSKKHRKIQFVEVCLRGDDGNVLLAAGRRASANDKDGDAVYFLAQRPDGSSVEVSMMLDEAEDYLDAVTTLVSDTDARPFMGNLAVDTRSGSSGGQLEFAIDQPDDHTARVSLRAAGEPIEFEAARGPLERFLFAVREGICEDLEDDD